MFFTWLQKVSPVFDAASIRSEFSPSQETKYRVTHVDLFLQETSLHGTVRVLTFFAEK